MAFRVYCSEANILKFYDLSTHPVQDTNYSSRPISPKKSSMIQLAGINLSLFSPYSFVSIPLCSNPGHWSKARVQIRVTY